MPKICYREKRFNEAHQAVIDQANTIIASYAQQGFNLTLRQLYYQFVSRDLIPNTERSYKNLGVIISDARLAGQIDWDAIIDRTRNLQSLSHWESPADIVEACAKQFRVDKWDGQRYRVECFLPNTPVVTSEGLVEIASVCVGDKVLSHTGQWRTVTKIIRNNYDGRLLKLTPVGCLPIGVTPNHPFYAEAADRSKPGYKGAQRRHRKTSWVFSEELAKYDLLRIPCLPREALPECVDLYSGSRARAYRIPFSSATLHVVGLYLAEGSVRGDGRTIQFTFGAKETSFEQIVVEWAKSVGVGFSTAAGRGTRIVYVYSKALAAWFETEFGSGAWNKRLPGWLFKAPPAGQMEVFKFYFLGDGTFWDKTRSSCRATTRSKLLAEAIHFLLLADGYPACIGVAKDHDEPRYSVEVNGAAAVKLAEFFGVKIPAKGLGRSTRYNYIRTDEFCARVPLRATGTEHYSGPVFNLEVETDHSYCVPVAAHNCWIEKDALVGVIDGVCKELDVPYFSCRGYTSQSEMWGAAQRLREHLRNGQTPLILHLGDHDPSGKDMTRDITDRLAEFTGRDVELNRLALNMDQIEQYSPPPNPAKITDSRAKAYIAEFGGESWELDALEPQVMADLIRNAILEVREEAKWAVKEEEERGCRAKLQAVSDQWEQITEGLDGD